MLLTSGIKPSELSKKIVKKKFIENISSQLLTSLGRAVAKAVSRWLPPQWPRFASGQSTWGL
jgi:hypothetical protein